MGHFQPAKQGVCFSWDSVWLLQFAQEENSQKPEPQLKQTRSSTPENCPAKPPGYRPTTSPTPNSPAQHDTAHFLSMVSILGAPGTHQNPRCSPTRKGNPSLETVQHNLPGLCGPRKTEPHILSENLCDAGQFEMLLAEIQAYRICCHTPRKQQPPPSSAP